MAVKTPTDEVVSQLAVYLQRVTSGRRWGYVAFAALGCGTFWILAALLYFFGVAPAGLFYFGLGLTVALPLLALLAEARLRPSLKETAALIDRRLDDNERLMTAMQLIEQAETGKMARAQLATTADMLTHVDPSGVYPQHRPWPALALAAAMIFFALGIFLIRGANSNFSPLSAGSLPPVANNAGIMPTMTPPAGLPPSEPSDSASVPGNTNSVSVLSPQDAAAQTQASVDAKQALDALGQALNGQSATQGVVDSLKRGDYAGAGQQLQQLGQQSDQLSDQAKKDLSQALNNAAANAGTAPSLQQAEQNAANALNGSDYQAIANALNNLAIVVSQAGDKVIPQQQLTQLYQATPSPIGAQGQAQGSPNGQQDPNSLVQTQATITSQATPQNNQQGQQGQQGQSSGQSPQGNGSGASPSSNSGTRITGAATSPDPTVTGNPFDLGSDAGSDTTSGNTVPAGPNDQGLTVQGSDTGTSSAGPQTSGDAVNSPADTNDEPINRRQIIEKYFSH